MGSCRSERHLPGQCSTQAYWVGPPAEAIEALGDKQEAKKIMTAAGVPVLPTLDPGDVDVEYPVLVKAAAGAAVRACGSLKLPLI